MERPMFKRVNINGWTCMLCSSCCIVLGADTHLCAQDERAGPPTAERWRSEIPWTEAELNPDVAMRPRFIAALAGARLPKMFRASDPSLSGDSIPENERAEFESYLANVLVRDCVPRDWASVQRGAYAVPDRPGGRLGEPWIELATWSTALGTIGASRVRNASSFVIRLQLHRGHRLDIHPRPAQTEEFRPGVAAWDNWAVVDRDAFHSLLTSLLRVPFNSPEDYILKQGGREFEGVMVFHGILRAAETRGDGRRELRPRSASAWHHRINVLVTDSDPQYFGVSIDLRAEAESSRKDTKITPQEP